MKYVGWPTKVNRSVLDSAQVTAGEGATKEETLENGKKRGRPSQSHAPKTFSVTMRFNYVDKDANGLTEKDRFWRWYENVLQYSVNEFQFADLMYGLDTERLCWYRITGAVNGAKSGLEQEIQMKWESCYEGVITAEEDPVEPSYIEAVDGCVTFHYTGVPQVSPTTNDFGELVIVTPNADPELPPTTETVQLEKMRYFENACVYLYFAKRNDGKDHSCYFTNYPDLTDTFHSELEANNNG